MFKNLLLIVAVIIFVAGFGLLLNKNLPQTRKVIVDPTPRLVSLDPERLTKLINNWRISQGLQSYIRSEDLCKIAKDRVLNDAPLDDHKGLYEKYSNYPYVIQENLTSADTEGEALSNWGNSSPHLATLKKPYKYSCVYCKGNYCSQIFSSFLKN